MAGGEGLRMLQWRRLLATGARFLPAAIPRRTVVAFIARISTCR